MKTVEINNVKYEVINNDNDCLDPEDLKEKITDYFDNYDYIFGDFSYDKVRLKGYYDSSNKKATKINNIAGLEEYKKLYCNFGCKSFLLKKIK